MTVFYKNISDIIPFEINTLIDLSNVSIFDSPLSHQFVHKQSFSPVILNSKFLSFLKDKSIEVEKVLIWHWYIKDANWAHIDSNAEGVISCSAINWTLNKNITQVNFYNLNHNETAVRFGNEVDQTAQTDNVTSYIAINVNGSTPDAIWDDQGPAVINTSIPHLVVANQLRTSVSLNFVNPRLTVETIIDRLYR